MRGSLNRTQIKINGRGTHSSPETDGATVVDVKGPENIVAELFCVAGGENGPVQAHKLLSAQLVWSGKCELTYMSPCCAFLLSASQSVANVDLP